MRLDDLTPYTPKCENFTAHMRRFVLNKSVRNRTLSTVDVKYLEDEIRITCEAQVWEAQGRKTTLDLHEVSYERPVSLWDECKARLPWLVRVFGPPKTVRVVLRKPQTVNLCPHVQFPVLPHDRAYTDRFEWIVVSFT